MFTEWPRWRYWLALISVLSFTPSLSQAEVPAKTTGYDGILYGASYYHEYMPEDRLEQDVQLIAEGGHHRRPAG